MRWVVGERKIVWPILLAGGFAVSLAGCSENSNEVEPEATADMAVSSEATMIGETTWDSAQLDITTIDPMPAGLPQLAYRYGYAYEAPTADLPGLMRKHADLCEDQGVASCRVIGMDMSGSAAADDVGGTLQLAVASSHARAVSALLEDEADNFGATQLFANIASDEMSRKIVDMEAHIEARTELRDRLLEVLRKRSGSVEELVEAERQVAAINGEIDAAKSQLSDTEGQVAFSRLDISYASAGGVAGAFFDPVSDAAESFGSIAGWVVALLIMLSAVLLPIGAVALVGRAVKRKISGTPTAFAEA